MKKFKSTIFLITSMICMLILSGCGNKMLIDTHYEFNKAIIAHPDNTYETVNIKSWDDYENSDQIQLMLEDGTVYLVHSTNCTLIYENISDENS